MKCPNCSLPNASVKCVIRHHKLLTGCDKCLDTLIQGNELAAQHKREEMRRSWKQDIVQPTEKRDYAKLYPEKFRQLYGDEEYRKYS